VSFIFLGPSSLVGDSAASVGAFAASVGDFTASVGAFAASVGAFTALVGDFTALVGDFTAVGEAMGGQADEGWCWPMGEASKHDALKVP